MSLNSETSFNTVVARFLNFVDYYHSRKLLLALKKLAKIRSFWAVRRKYLGKIRIFRAATRKYLSETNIFWEAIEKIRAESEILGKRQGAMLSKSKV